VILSTDRDKYMVCRIYYRLFKLNAVGESQCADAYWESGSGWAEITPTL